MKAIKTRHKSGSIYKLEFSRQGTYVMTLSGCSDTTNLNQQFDRNSYLSTNKNIASMLGNNSGSMIYNMGNNINYNNIPQINYISLEII